MRSFTEPPGFRYSSFARSSPGTSRPSRSSRTIGVFPTSSSTVGNSRRAIGGEAYFAAFSASAQNSPVSPTASSSAWDSSTERGVQPGSSRDHHQARASSFICGAGTVAPGSQPFAVEPALEVLLRPEEDHRASGEADVVPPAACGNENVAQEVGAPDELAVTYDELERIPAARALRRDLPVRVERARNPERVPAARPGPDPAAGSNSVRRRREAERVRHPDVRRAGEQDERMRVVETPVRVRDLVRLVPSTQTAVSLVVGGRPFATTEK